MTGGAAERCDAVVVGGGFYGCCLALFLRGIADNVVLVEAEKDLLTRASYVNQARIHTGFHYPRSFVTARRSLALYQRFMAEFADAVVDDFTMLYAIARSGSKVTPQRFVKMFEGMGAPIAPASAAERALFEPRLIADVLRCREYAFDASRLRLLLRQRLERAGVRLLNGTRVETIRPARPPAPITVTFADRPPLAARMVFDATYGQFALQQGGNYQAIPLKYELAEIALVKPPPELAGLGVTVMDGPSLTHVRYTPHRAWTSREVPALPAGPVTSAWMHMQRDAMRYLPALSRLQWHESLYEVKTVLLRNETDDGRPILLHRNTVHPNYMTVLGGKLDNVYDLFEALIALGPPFNRAMAAAATADPQ